MTTAPRSVSFSRFTVINEYEVTDEERKQKINMVCQINKKYKLNCQQSEYEAELKSHNIEFYTMTYQDLVHLNWNKNRYRINYCISMIDIINEQKKIIDGK